MYVSRMGLTSYRVCVTLFVSLCLAYIFNEVNIMRNASTATVVGQAMRPLTLPAKPMSKIDWSALYPNYEERMKAMSLYVCLLLREWNV